MRAILPFVTAVTALILLASPGRAADLDRPIVLPPGEGLPPPAVVYGQPVIVVPPPAEAEAEARARYYHSPYPNPYAGLPILPSDPYAPSFLGAPLSPPTYGYGY